MNDFVAIVSNGSVSALLAVALWVAVVGAFREWWVPGPVHRRMMAERDKALSERDQAHRRTDAVMRLLYHSQNVNDAAITAIVDATESRP